MSSTARILKPFLARQWRALAGAGGATVTLTAADLAKPWPVALAIDHLLLGREGGFELTAADTRVLALIGGLVVAIAALDALSTYLADLWLQRAGERINHELRVALYSHLQRLSLGFHQRRPKGDLVTRVTGDVNAVGSLFADSLGPMLQSALLLMGVLAVSAVLDPVLALVAFAATPVIAAVSIRYRRKVREAARRQRRQEGEIASIANEALSAMPVVKAFGSERYEHDRVERHSERRMGLGVEVARLQARFEGLIGVISAAGTALVIVVGVMRVAAGALSPGDLVVFASYARKIDSPLRALAKHGTKLSRAMARADRIAEVLSTEEVLEERPGAYDGARAAGEVRLDRLSFGYEPGRPVLHDVSLHVPAGSCVALVGPSGSGKSTLGGLVARFHDPDTGAVRIDGRDARDCSLPWLRDQIGVLLQDTVLFNASVAENIAYATEAGHEKVRQAARLAVAEDFIEELPEGYETVLGPQGGGLSGGQRQRIGIARSLLRDPPVLILDEPTTGLDSESRDKVVDGLLTLMRGRTTVLITHSVELARKADRVVVMEAGRIVRDAPAAELLADGTLLASIAEPPRPPGRRVPAVPRDDALPQLPRLLDADGMAPVLERSLQREVGIGDVRVERVRYKPGRRLVVHYGVWVDGRRHDAVATAEARVDLAARARERGWLEQARTVNGRSPSRMPIAFDDDLGAMISWLPFDPALPALAVPPPELARALREAGVPMDGSPPGEARLLGYKPGARAVLGLAGHVVKAYGKPRQFERALTGLRGASALRAPAPRLEGAISGLRLTVQAEARGSPPADAAGAAGLAAELARLVRRSPVAGLAEAPPSRQLGEATRHAGLARVIVPPLRGRLDRLVTRLAAGVPESAELAPAHGDFHVDQLLADGDDVALIDLDDMCLAPAALDPATYAADVVRGRPGDLNALDAVLAPLLEGYGRRPAGFDWYLACAVLCRCTHPFRGLADDWPERVEATVGVAEEVLSR